MKKSFLFICLATAFSFACARVPIRSVEEAMRPTKTLKLSELNDDLKFAALAEGLEKNVARLKTPGAAGEFLRFGSRKVATPEYVAQLQKLLDAMKGDPSGQEFLKLIDAQFELMEVFGGQDWGDVFITSYYEPLLRGSSRRTEEFSEPLYEVPDDLVTVRLIEFEKAYGPYRAPSADSKPLEGVLRARVITHSPNSLIFPYWTRAEIEKASPLKNAKILAWVDPIDAFFLHTQGSGRVTMVDGSGAGREVRVGYADQNGYPYVSVGKNIFDKIPKDKMSRQKIEAYLRSLPKEQARALMNENPSFIFFQNLKGGALSSFGAEVTPGRTIATDGKYFPKGALAFLQFQMPDFANPLESRAQGLGAAVSDSGEPVAFHPVSRFVLDQDTGGAIKGPARVDLFAGSGPDADRMSGVMRHRGRLYYLVPRQ